LKEEDSELRFVENNFLTALTGQSTHQDLVKKSGLRRILFHKKSGLQRILLMKNPLLQDSEMHFFQVSYSVYQFFRSENGLNSNTE